ncbi:hypothetical protein [Luteolibacter rhizosphaerae]|uniref:hypothetical protein n=1 Tax=Luteolibacter rhizosphaerae TaxID=2989719 RepID=UPI00222217E0|nr:hypothetical protein [Luteolibacter rhizosphaerae]
MIAVPLAGCSKKEAVMESEAALKGVRGAARDVVVKTAESEKALATEEQKDDLRRAENALKQAEKKARESGAAETQLWEQRRIGETEGKKIVLQYLR